MTPDNKRYYKQFKKRASVLAAERVESLGAAFIKETGLLASKTMLCSRTVEREGVPQFEMWYAERPADADLSQTHPDVAFMADIVHTLVSFNKNPDDKMFVKACRALADTAKDVIAKYESQTTTTMSTDDDIEVPEQTSSQPVESVGELV